MIDRQPVVLSSAWQLDRSAPSRQQRSHRNPLSDATVRADNDHDDCYSRGDDDSDARSSGGGVVVVVAQLTARDNDYNDDDSGAWQLVVVADSLAVT